MLVCTGCKVIMKCILNGVSCDFGNNHTYPGDMFQCPVCKQSTINTNHNPAYDPEYKFSDYYLKMESNINIGIKQDEINSYIKKHFGKTS